MTSDDARILLATVYHMGIVTEVVDAVREGLARPLVDRWERTWAHDDRDLPESAPAGYEAAGAWEPFALDTRDGVFCWKRPLRKVTDGES